MIIFVASPYSDDDPFVQDSRYHAVRAYIAWRCRTEQDNFTYFSPIVYCHEMAKMHQLPKSAAWWEKFNIPYIKVCSHVNVLTLRGWEESKGIQKELALARSLGKPVEFWRDHVTRRYTQVSLDL